MKQEFNKDKESLEENNKQLNRMQKRVNDTYFYYERYLHNKLSELRGNIRVFCRARPILPKDI